MNGKAYKNSFVLISLLNYPSKAEVKSVGQTSRKKLFEIPKDPITEPRSTFQQLCQSKKVGKGKSFEICNTKINLGSVAVASRSVSFLMRWHFLQQQQHENLR